MKKFTFVLLLVFFAVASIYVTGCVSDAGNNLNQNPPVTATDGALVMKSTNGGLNWEKHFIPNYFLVWRICYLSNYSNSKTAMILSRNGNDIGDLNSTTNFGQSWSSYFQTSGQLIDIATVPGGGTNGGENFAVTVNSEIVKSSDQGTTWQQTQYGNSANSIDFYQRQYEQNIGMIMPQNSQDSVTFYENYNWLRKSPVSTDPEVYLSDFKIIDDSTIIVCGNDGFISRSTDSGDNWEILETTISADLRSMDYFGGVIIIGTDEGNIVRSADKGESWTEITTGLKTLNGVFTHTTSFWAFGTNAIVKSTDQGLTWSQVYYDEFDRFYDMIIDNNTIYAAGGRYVYN